jgi:trehalose 6-phosphate synthase
VAGADVLIASNRGPLSFRRSESGEITSARGGGGLVSAMVAAAAGDDSLWLCATLSEVDREIAAASPDGRIDLAGYDTGGAAVAMLDVDPATLHGAYTSISNETLWRLNHDLVDLSDPPTYDDAWRLAWAAYVAYNERFATAIAQAASPNAKVLVQDYHLDLAPAMIRERRPDLRIAHFTHTPWARRRTFELLPADVGAAIIRGLLGADSVGFHSPRWATDFADCAIAVTEAGYDGEAVELDGRTVPLRIHPLGVDAAPLLDRAAEPDVADRARELRAAVGGRRVIGRVDRTEPAKNVYLGLLAFAELLRIESEHRDRVVHVVLAYPSRQDVVEYRRYTELCLTTAEKINAEFGTTDWQPVLLEVRDDYPRSLAPRQQSDVLLINPLRDGMNLVAKEGSLLTADAVLVLSREAGAADEMGADALLVDPTDVAATADALHRALTMPAEERARRHRGLAAAAVALPPHAWLEQQLDVLD